jgi:hypothetical protein
MTEQPQKLPGDFLVQPIAIALIGLWLINDHWLKAAHPGWLSGKLSDVTSLAVCPLLALAAAELTWPRLSPRAGRFVLLAAIAAVGALMVSVKLLPEAAWAYRWGLGLLQWPLRSVMALAAGDAVPALHPVRLAMDPSDLLTLPSLLIAWAIGRRADELPGQAITA